MSDTTPLRTMASFERADKLARARRWCLFIAFVALAVWYASCWDRIPTIEGRVVDAQTGRPIAGVLVMRHLYQPPPFEPFEGSTEQSMRGSYAQATSDASGRFSLPGMWGYRAVAMAWVLWSPGYMPGRGCYKHASWERYGGCPGGMGFYGVVDPWVLTTFTENGRQIGMDIALYPPTLEGVTFYGWDAATRGQKPYTPKPGSVDPWGEYFRRLNVLVDSHLLDAEVFDGEAVGYVDGGGAVTEAIAWPLHERLRAHRSSDVCADEHLRRVLAALNAYSIGNPTAPFSLRRVSPVDCASDPTAGGN